MAGDDTVSLVRHGFVDAVITKDFSNICDVLPHTHEIARLGKEQEISREKWRFLTRPLDISGQHVGWTLGDLHNEGTYGKIYKAHRMVVTRRPDNLFSVTEAAHRVILKQTHPPSGSSVLPAEDVTAHTSEALLHILSWHIMQKTATPWAIPRPYEVFGERSETVPGWRSMAFCMSYVRGDTLMEFLQEHWKPQNKSENARLFIEIIAQIAYILWHLQQRLQLNHRDMKVNNILIRKCRQPFTLEFDGIQFTTQYAVTLIDFGFACVGCPPPRTPMTAFQAGSWFPFGELCCKQGRDLAQLLFCIHCYFPLDVYLPHVLVTEIHEWLQFPWVGGTADAFHGFTKEGRPRRNGTRGKAEYHTGIYEFLRRPDVDPVACAPLPVFKNLLRLAKDVK